LLLGGGVVVYWWEKNERLLPSSRFLGLQRRNFPPGKKELGFRSLEHLKGGLGGGEHAKQRTSIFGEKLGRNGVVE